MKIHSPFRGSDLVFLGALIVVAAALRFYRLGTGLWYDEIVTVLDSVRRPLGEIVTQFPSNNHHPLYAVLGRIAVVALGEAPCVVRLPSALFGVAAIPMLYVTGLAVTTRAEAAAASVILTVSYHHIWFSQNARGYTALLFFTLLSTFALVRWFESRRGCYLFLYVAAIAAGCYAHLSMVFVCVSHALACGIDLLMFGPVSRARIEKTRLVGAFAGAGVLTLVLYAPMLRDVFSHFTTESNSGTEVATPAWAILAALRGLQVGFGSVWAIVIGGLVFLVGAWSYFRQRPTAALFFLLPLPVTVVVAIALGQPIRPRFLFFGMGLVLLVVMRGATSLGGTIARLVPGKVTPQHAAAAMLAMTVLGGIVVSARSLPYGYRYPKQDYVQAVAFVEREKDDMDVVAVIGETSARPVLEYLNRPWRRIERGDEFRELSRVVGRIWVIYTFSEYIDAGQPDLWKALQDECTAVTEFEGTVEGGGITVGTCD